MRTGKRNRRNKTKLTSLLLILGALSSQYNVGLAATPPPGYHACTFRELLSLEDKIASSLNAATPQDGADENFTLLLRSGSRNFTYSRNNIRPLSESMTPNTAIASASTAKMVTVAVIMDLVENPILQTAIPTGQKKLTLDSYVKDFLPERAWLPANLQPQNPRHVFQSMTLRHLLSFTSGLELEDKCIGSATGVVDDCIRTILQKNLPRANEKTTRQFFYNGSHLLVAARLASVVTGKSWFQIFAEFKGRYKVFQTSFPDSLDTTLFGAQYLFSRDGQIPNPAGAMRYVIKDYNDFMAKFYANGIGAYAGDLSKGERLKNTMLTNQLVRSEQEKPLTNGVYTGTPWDGQNPIVYSPARDEIENGLPVISRDGEDWRYGLGNWVECSAQPWRGEQFSSRCLTGIHSSPGSFGAYAFIDKNMFQGFSYPITGMIGRQGNAGSFNPYLYRKIRDLAAQWGSKFCRN